MRLSERMQKSVVAEVPSPEPAARPTPSLRPAGADPGEPKVSDPFADLKTRAHEALFARLGMRLFDSSLSEEQLRTLVVQEITTIVDRESAPLSPAERQRVVSEVSDDILG